LSCISGNGALSISRNAASWASAQKGEKRRGEAETEQGPVDLVPAERVRQLAHPGSVLESVPSGGLLFGYFLLAMQEKVTRPAKGGMKVVDQ
jgi:hypothetical protein